MYREETTEVTEWEMGKLLEALDYESTKDMEEHLEAYRIHLKEVRENPFEVIVLNRGDMYSITLEMDENGTYWKISPCVNEESLIPIREWDAIPRVIQTVSTNWLRVEAKEKRELA